MKQNLRFPGFFVGPHTNKWSQMASPSSLMSQMEPGDSTSPGNVSPSQMASFELNPCTSNNHPLEKRITCLGSENQFINFRCCSNPDFCLNPCVFDSHGLRTHFLRTQTAGLAIQHHAHIVLLPLQHVVHTLLRLFTFFTLQSWSLLGWKIPMFFSAKHLG